MTKLSRQIFNKIISAALIFWLSGLMFLLCCEAPKTNGEITDSCPLAKNNHCLRTGKVVLELSAFAAFQSAGQTLDCCILPSIFDKARKIEPNLQSTAGISPAVKIAEPVFFIAESNTGFSKIYRPPVSTRQKTYLKNCVFRI